jgi:23S rRNA (cytosine1962-C5)-methyltransferase
MRIAENWKEYELIDCTCGERLERWGDILLIRPDPQVIWKSERATDLWEHAHARYDRSSRGGGQWEFFKKLPDFWEIGFGALSFRVKTMGFKHTGLFPEQAVNWEYVSDLIRNANREIRLLNLFAYTGGATVSALAAGAAVTHVDAAKGMVAWAKENAQLSGVAKGNVRWIVDDCVKFVRREIRRGGKYDAIILDPPSYGRGPSGEVWKLSDELFGFTELCGHLLSDAPLFVLLNSYSAGLSAGTMQYVLGTCVQAGRKGRLFADEIGLRVKKSALTLPCGASAYWLAD